MAEDFYKEKYFNQLNERLDTLETKIDDLSTKITYMRGWAMGAGAFVGAFSAFIMDKFLK